MVSIQTLSRTSLEQLQGANRPQEPENNFILQEPSEKICAVVES
jgi:hypothetical protein